MSAAIDELKFAFRSLTKVPVLSFVAILTLGLGIGMNALMFSLVYGALFRGLPFPQEDRIVRVTWIDPAAPENWRSVSLRDFTDLKAQQNAVGDLAGITNGTMNLAGIDRPVRFDGAWITWNGFQALQVQPILGRTFTEEEGRPGAPLAIILGHHVWEGTFAADPNILGRAVRINGEEGTIVGVMPPGFQFPDTQDLWIPLRDNPLGLARDDGPFLEVYGRLEPGVSMEQAGTEFTGLVGRLEPLVTDAGVPMTITVRKFSDPPRDMKMVFMTLLATTIMILLVACTNVANLLLARAAGRTKELAVNIALGASRRRIMSKLVAEATVLVGFGAALGIFLGWLGLRVTFALAVTSPPPFWFIFEIDGPVLLFVVAASGLAAFVAGVIPGMRVTGTKVSAILKDEGRGASGLRIGRLSRLLVVSELAFSVALLVAAGLMVKGMMNMRNLDYGIFQDETFTARVGLFERDFPDPAHQRQFFVDLQERLRNRPEITQVALTSALPGFTAAQGPVEIQGMEYQGERDYPRVGTAYISPGFFQTFGVDIMEGRDFTEQDDMASEPVAIVNQSFAARHFPGQDPLGRQIRSGAGDETSPWRTIVGVVPDLYMEGLTNGDTFHPNGYYAPMTQVDIRFASIAVKGPVGPQAMGQILQEEVATLHADTPLYWMRTMARGLRETIWYVDLFGGLFGVFGGLALLMAAAGLYAVMATGVAQRTREVGIRMALGARAGSVLGMVLRQGVFQIGLGLTFGLVLALLVSRGIQAMLFGVEPWDLNVFLTISGVMLASGVLASLIPARRATRVDPVEALRSE
jgi:putative ABC transport system permease protein